MKKVILSLLITLAIAGGGYLGFVFMSPNCPCNPCHCNPCNCK